MAGGNTGLYDQYARVEQLGWWAWVVSQFRGRCGSWPKALFPKWGRFMKGPVS